MKQIAALLVRGSTWVLFFFGALTAVAVALIPQVRINYNLAEYVPTDSPSTVAMNVMAEEFDDQVPNVRVYVPDVSLPEALAIKQRIAELPRVQSVIWLDDFVDLLQPVELADQRTVAGFYHAGGALYQVSAELDDAPATMAQLQQIATDSGAVEGQLLDIALAQSSVSSEIATITAIMVPLGVLILMLSTRAWLDPPLLLITIGVAVALNMGSNLVLGEISFITAAVTGVLQLAVSMDYGIFLLHARERHLAAGADRRTSLELAIQESSRAILASASTTILGFLALVFMRFGIGPDLGVVLAKGVVLSLICVLVLMPALQWKLDRVVRATGHRELLPGFAGLGRGIARFAGVLLLIGVLLPFAQIAQGHNDFRYGNSEYPAGSRASADREFIQQTFGRDLPMALLVPRGDPGRERLLEAALAELPEVRAITSYQSRVGRLLPAELLPAEQIAPLISQNYARLVLTVDTAKEGPQAFELVTRVRATAQRFYPDQYLLAGESVATLDMRDTITADNIVVNGLAIVSVGMVLLISFRSLSLPLLLLLTIEGSIWINLTVPYLSGTHLTYIGFLVISTVQLGATVDYAILFTQHHLANRARMARRAAIAATIAETFGTLLGPAAILTAAGVILSVVSSLEVVSQLGTVLGRGALLSFLMVNLFLPGLLLLFDRVIEKTTMQTTFWRSQP